MAKLRGLARSRAHFVRLVWSVWCVLSLSSSSTSAWAAGESGERTPAPDQAESLFESALALKRSGQLERACEAFELSAELAASPHALLQVGNCREPRDPLGALTSFEAALAAAGKVTDPTRRQAYEKAARQRIGPLLVRIPSIVFQESPTPGVRVEIAPVPGGAAQVVTRFGEPQRFNPGKYQVRALAAGFAPYLLDLDLQAEQRLDIEIPALAALPAPSEEPVISREPATRAPLALHDDSGAMRFGALPVALAGTGAALILTSVVTGRVSSAARDKLEQQCGPPDAFTGLRACSEALAGTKSRVEDYALATDVLWIGGTLLAAAGVTWFLLDQNAAEAPRVEAGCSGVGCGVSMTGSF